MEILRIDRVMKKRGNFTPTSVYNDIRAGLLTRPVKIGVRSVGWPEHEIETLIAAQVAAKPRDQIKKLVEQLHDRRNQLLSQEVLK